MSSRTPGLRKVAMLALALALCIAIVPQMTRLSGAEQELATSTVAANPIWPFTSRPSPEEERIKQANIALEQQHQAEVARLKAQYDQAVRQNEQRVRQRKQIDKVKQDTKDGFASLVSSTQNTVVKTKEAIRDTMKKLNIPEGVLAGVGIGVGLILTFFGYKLYKPTLFLGGAGLGGTIAFVILANVTQNDLGQSFSSNLPNWVPYVIMGVSALLLGAIAVGLAHVGIAMLGALAGSALGLFTLALLLHLNVMLPRAAEIAIMAGCAVLGGMLIVWQKRFVIAFATSFGGALLTFACADAFAQTGFVATLEQSFQGKNMKTIRWQSLQHQSNAVYGMLAGIVALFLVGLTVQLIVSKRTGNAWSPRSKNPYAPAIGRSIYY